MIEKKFKELCDICDEAMKKVYRKEYDDTFNLDPPEFEEKRFFYPKNPQTKFYNEVHDFMKKLGISYEFKLIGEVETNYDKCTFYSLYALSWYDTTTHLLFHRFETLEENG